MTIHRRPVLSSLNANRRCLFSLRQKTNNRHFDRSCSRLHREQRSGEIHFSTSAASATHAAFAVALVFGV
jgi:hypothetical protein